jgi:MFS family permease
MHADAEPRAWAPLANPVFRALAIAQFVSNVGTWMQTVGAQWEMGSLGADPLLIALIQTATSLPIFLLALPSGALGDIIDRRRLLLGAQTFMLCCAAALAVVTATGVLSPGLLLALTFLLGAGQAFTSPAWQAIQPELVPRVQVPHAAALGATSMNVARAVGPAIGGVVVAAVGAEAVFALNAVTFLGVLGVLWRWRRPVHDKVLGAEHLRSAIRAGVRYLSAAPRLRAILVRTLGFVVFASALWALLPIVARSQLGLGSGGYGLLLGAVGIGAIAGAGLLPSLRARLSGDGILAGAALLYAAACMVTGFVHVAPLVGVALVGAGVAWISAVGSLNGSTQRALPGWVRSRGMALYLLVFQGGQALGAFVWGLVVQHADVRIAFGAVAAGLTASLLLALRWPLRRARSFDTSLAPYPEPQLRLDPPRDAGPVLVTVRYRVPDSAQEDFRATMRLVARARRRSGAERWGLFRDGDDPDVFLETFIVPTWEEHLRQHLERPTATDREFMAAARALQDGDGEVEVHHLFSAYGR